MKLQSIFLIVSRSIALAGCMTYEVDETGTIIPDEQVQGYETWPEELEGRTVMIETDESDENRSNFEPNGIMNILVDPEGPVVQVSRVYFARHALRQFRSARTGMLALHSHAGRPNDAGYQRSRTGTEGHDDRAPLAYAL